MMKIQKYKNASVKKIQTLEEAITNMSTCDDTWTLEIPEGYANTTKGFVQYTSCGVYTFIVCK